MSKVTIKDIARLLHLNPSTVSRALRDHPDISLTTKAAVKKLAEDLSYHPSYQAIHFREKKSGLIGLIIPEMNMFFMPSIIDTIEKICREHHYQLLVFQSNNHVDLERSNARICEQFGVDGLLVSLTPETRDIDHFLELHEEGIPIIMFDKVINHPAIPRVVIDDFQAAFDAVGKLNPKPGETLCGIFGDPGLGISDNRLQGFLAGIKEHQISSSYTKILFAKNAFETRDYVSDMLMRGGIPDAIFTMSDETLMGLGSALIQSGNFSPIKSRIIAISEGILPNFLFPSVSFFEHSAKEVAKASIELLLSALLSKEEISGKEITIPIPFRQGNA